MRAAVVAGVVLLASTACARVPDFVGSGGSGTADTRTTAGVTAKIVSLTADQALKTTIRGLDSGVIRKATMGTIDDGRPALNVVVKVPSADHGDQALAEWEAGLLAGAAAERLTSSGDINAAIGYLQTTALDSTGDVVDSQGAAMPPVAAGARFPAADLSDSEILKRVRADTREQGWRLVAARVLHPLDPAVVMTVRIPSGAPGDLTSYRHWQVAVGSLGLDISPDACTAEGFFAEIQDAAGAPVLRSAWNCRIGGGSVWNAPNGPIQIPHSGPPDASSN